ncbi:unnamed protein product [Dracunculus medinensis]|uniref:Superoxide dismutase [Cu-Zn] n=1 Tax=Dracunculus medinensis TaxID=318479 RepID=A0A0N4US54_DRAME|nr:unnamed protein product [Dracunculus medinensis]
MTIARNGQIIADAVIQPIKKSGVTGYVKFMQNKENAPTIITGQIRGLSPGKHAFHIHEHGDLSRDCLAAGPPYNPINETHGGPLNRMRHVSNLGNVFANVNGIATIYITAPLIQLRGPISVIGRTIVVHMNSDDLGLGTTEAQATSQLTGNAGQRIGCGVIKRRFGYRNMPH